MAITAVDSGAGGQDAAQIHSPDHELHEAAPIRGPEAVPLHRGHGRRHLLRIPLPPLIIDALSVRPEVRYLNIKEINLQFYPCRNSRQLKRAVDRLKLES